LGEVVSVRIQNEQLANNTVNALVLNDLIGKALQSYGKAMGFKADEHSGEHEGEHAEEKDGQETEDHGQVSIPSFSKSIVNIALIDSAKNQDASNKNITNAEIVDQVEYQIAQALINKSIEKFNELKPSITSNMSNLSSILESSLVKLKNAVDNKESFEVIDDIVDDEVTPQLESIFKIKIEEE
jgi:tRNA U34 5-carboxymethylaminomethyl modifying enzyme MnmG/GidA